MTIQIIREVLETHCLAGDPGYDEYGRPLGSGLTEKCTGCPWIGWDHRLHVAKMIDAAIFSDERFDAMGDAIESAMADHESLRNDSSCACGVRNNMDGDVLFTHRVGAICVAARNGLLQGVK